MSEVFANCGILKNSVEDLDWTSPKNQPRYKKALDILHTELDMTMALCGHRNLKKIDKSILKM